MIANHFINRVKAGVGETVRQPRPADARCEPRGSRSLLWTPAAFKLRLRGRRVRSRDQAARSTLQSDDAPHEETSLNDIFETLATWIRKEGGYVHDTLRLVKKDNRRGRGVITTQLISGDLLKCPAILIPESRVLASSSAADLLGEKIDESARQNLANFDGDLQLGLFLAHERNKGEASEWHPALASLPDPPPAMWLEDPAKVAMELRQLGSEAAGWQQLLFQERARREMEARNMFEVLGDDLNVTMSDVLWGIGQALSCTMDDEGEAVWVPLVDLIGHDASAPPLFTDDRTSRKAVTWLWQDRDIQVGQELVIDYGFKDPLVAFVTHGFLPVESMQ